MWLVCLFSSLWIVYLSCVIHLCKNGWVLKQEVSLTGILVNLIHLKWDPWSAFTCPRISNTAWVHCNDPALKHNLGGIRFTGPMTWHTETSKVLLYVVHSRFFIPIISLSCSKGTTFCYQMKVLRLLRNQWSNNSHQPGRNDRILVRLLTRNWQRQRKRLTAILEPTSLFFSNQPSEKPALYY